MIIILSRNLRMILLQRLKITLVTGLIGLVKPDYLVNIHLIPIIIFCTSLRVFSLCS